MRGDSDGGPVRAFAALPLPGEALARLERAGRELKRRSSDFRVVRPEGMHVTLFFFGDLEMERLEQVRQALRDPGLGVPAVQASLGGLGRFPPRGSPRVLYCPVLRGREEIEELHRRLREALLAAWYPNGGARRGARSGEAERPSWDDRRAFTPHVTVARSRGGRAGYGVPAGVEELFAFDQPACLDRVVLFQSVLKPEGAEYRPLEILGLTGGIP
ncbi:MAG: 2'-5' RNA ligase family protein [Spirochaetales bacterium]|nr:2'-5' RNA ligase family protein [Spirochaetales bacterium]